MKNNRRQQADGEATSPVFRREFLATAATAGSIGLAAATTAAQNKQPVKTPVKLNGAMIEYKSGDLVIPAYLSRPAKAQDAPAVLVIHEVFGLNDHIKSIADRVAQAGYFALAPHFFARSTETPPKDTSDIQALRKAAASIPPEAANRDMQAALDYLKTVKGVRPRFASVGFCMGGAYSYRLSAHSKDLRGAVIFYGRIPLELVPQVNCPILGNFAEEDSGIPPAAVQAWIEAMNKAGKTVDAKIYPSARHGFFNDTRPEAYNAQAAADAWQRTIKFFGERL
ncbi:MAG: dienelactone hydrolase family protein [Acidobacteriota bacterium]|nr:dienelactone hydrolase family protein [Acidobacteriota bacterium]